MCPHLTALPHEVRCEIFHLWHHVGAQQGQNCWRFQMLTSKMFDLCVTVILNCVSIFASSSDLYTNLTDHELQ